MNRKYELLCFFWDVFHFVFSWWISFLHTFKRRSENHYLVYKNRLCYVQNALRFIYVNEWRWCFLLHKKYHDNGAIPEERDSKTFIDSPMSHRWAQWCYCDRWKITPNRTEMLLNFLGIFICALFEAEDIKNPNARVSFTQTFLIVIEVYKKNVHEVVKDCMNE